LVNRNFEELSVRGSYGRLQDAQGKEKLIPNKSARFANPIPKRLYTIKEFAI
jgi:hypothetical protein